VGIHHVTKEELKFEWCKKEREKGGCTLAKIGECYMANSGQGKGLETQVKAEVGIENKKEL